MTVWPVKTLGDVCELVNGATPDTKVREYWGGKHAWITPAEMGGLDSPFISMSRRTLSDKGLASCSATMVPPKTVILSSRAPIGHLVINEVPMATNQGCKSLIPKDGLDFSFLYYYLKANVEVLESLGTGTTFKELSGTQLKTVEIPMPPLDEQKRIVALLDAATARVAELTACYEQARTHANNLFTSASREAFESNPDWPVKTIGDVCAVLDSLRKPITKRDRTSGDYPYYGATGIVDYVGDYIFDERLVLVGEDGAKWDAGDRTAFIAEGKFWVNNHAHVLRCKPGVLVDSWLTHYLTMSDLKRYVSGLTVPKLNQGSLVSIAIPVPPLEEQERIVGHLDSMKAKTSEMVATYDAKLTAAKNLRQSFLESAFEGKL
jgi:type I restriction enzyme S subunit